MLWSTFKDNIRNWCSSFIADLVRGSKQTLHLHCFHIYLDIPKHVGATGMAVSSCNEVWQPPGCHLLPIVQFKKRETWEWRWECDAINHLLQVSIKVGKLQNHPLCLPTTRQQDCRAAHLLKEMNDFLRLPTLTLMCLCWTYGWCKAADLYRAVVEPFLFQTEDKHIALGATFCIRS